MGLTQQLLELILKGQIGPNDLSAKQWHELCVLAMAGFTKRNDCMSCFKYVTALEAAQYVKDHQDFTKESD